MNPAAQITRDHWFPVALSRNCGSRPRRVMLFGKPIAIARDSSGKVLALEDRCPHRGAPLSAGCVTADALVCPYHGWSFDGEGRCRSMPGTADGLPLTPVRVAAWQVEERDGIVWLAVERSRALPSRLLALDPARRRFLWETAWNAPIIEAQDNFLDSLHTHLVHPGLVRGGAVRAPIQVLTRPAPDGFEIDYTGQQTQSGLLYRLFESPRTRERAHFSGLSVAQIEYRYASEWGAFITLCFSPEAATSTRVFTMLHVENRFAPAWLVRLVVWPFLRRVAMQDRRILGLQSGALEYFPTHRHVVTSLDVARPMLEQLWRGEQLPADAAREIVLWT